MTPDRKEEIREEVRRFQDLCKKCAYTESDAIHTNGEAGESPTAICVFEARTNTESELLAALDEAEDTQKVLESHIKDLDDLLADCGHARDVVDAARGGAHIMKFLTGQEKWCAAGLNDEGIAILRILNNALKRYDEANVPRETQ